MTPPTLVRLLDKDALYAVREVYHQSFPEAERRPWESLEGLLASADFHAWGITVGGKTVGMATVHLLDGFAYIEHLAVDPGLRGQGIGSAVIGQLKDKYPVLVLEAEPEDTSMWARRRIGFYLRHGFHILPYTYIQPPYAPGLPSVPLVLMSTNPTLPDPGLILHHSIYGL